MQDEPARKLGCQGTSDISNIIRSITEATGFFHERAGYAVMLFGARSDFGSSAEPFDMVLPVLEGFCETILGMTPLRVSQDIQAWMLSGGKPGRGSRLNLKDSAAARQEMGERLFKSFGNVSIYLRDAHRLQSSYF